MSKQPTRPRSSMGFISNSSRLTLSDFKRPPSRAPSTPGSPRFNRSRPGSAMGFSNGSRPMTPSQSEQYTGTIKVSIRPNPYTVDPDNNGPWEINDAAATISNNSDMTSLVFDNVFAANKALTNKEVYDRVCHDVVNKFLHEGFNSTVFAYGMTGSGKTFSMRGDEQNPGFVSLAVDAIFDKIGTDKSYSVSMSYLEIYNERIIDLLNPESTTTTELRIRDDPVYGTRIVGITSPDITSKQQLQQLIKKGDTNRKTSATDFNARSSRSHSILQIRLASADQNATLSLCDLAGSERATSSLERRKEGAFINKSLLALSTVINKLSMASTGSTALEHIPYRDSKLTRLLQPALSGSSLISILCTVHLGAASLNTVSETANTLRFAARAKDIVINVNKNRNSTGSDPESLRIIEGLKRTIEDQKAEISLLRARPTSTSGLNDTTSLQQQLEIAELEAENKILTERVEHFTRLANLQKAETVILKSDTLNDILGSGLETSHIMMANLENFYKRIQYELDEQKSYISHLENQLKLAKHENVFTGKKEEEKDSVRELTKANADKDEEILHLKELLKDKDHLINSLTKTSKLRRLVESTNVDTGIDKLEANKENYANLKSFKIMKGA